MQERRQTGRSDGTGRRPPSLARREATRRSRILSLATLARQSTHPTNEWDATAISPQPGEGASGRDRVELA
jgi:hypothetical protein